MEIHPLILTLRLDSTSLSFFDETRIKHFPKERNFLQAHLTLFHHLQNNEKTLTAIKSIQQNTFTINILGLKFLGAGVAYNVESAELTSIRKHLAVQLKDTLISQDRQGYRPHITIQNKVNPIIAKQLFFELSSKFTPFTCTAIGLDLWNYLGGPWQHHSYYDFNGR